MSSSPPDLRNILVLMPNWLGDAVMATPALRALRRSQPQAHITVMAKPAIVALLHGLPHADKLAPLPARGGLLPMLEAARAHAADARDAALVLPHSFRAALFARLSGARLRLGYARGQRSFLLTQAVPWPRSGGRRIIGYTAYEYLRLVQHWGAVPDDLGLELAVDPAEVTALRDRFKGAGPLIALAPGAAFGPSKCWPAARYAAVADRLQRELGARCVLLTGPGEEATRDEIRSLAQTNFLDPYEEGTSVERLKAAIALCDLFIGNDSGPRHVAIAFGRPVICIMGPTSPLYTNSPWERGEVLRVDVDCGPCQRPICSTDHRCMKRVEVDHVVQAAMRHLNSFDSLAPVHAPA